jgi:hypothetical protein
MDDQAKVRSGFQVERAHDRSRLGPELMAAAYERVVPIRRVPLPSAKQRQSWTGQEAALCLAM